MFASPRGRPPRRSVAAVTLDKSPAPMVPAPTASEVPKKERRLTERFGGLGFDVDVVNNDAVDLFIGFMAFTLAAIRFCHQLHVRKIFF